MFNLFKKENITISKMENVDKEIRIARQKVKDAKYELEQKEEFMARLEKEKCSGGSKCKEQSDWLIKVTGYNMKTGEHQILYVSRFCYIYKNELIEVIKTYFYNKWLKTQK